MKTLSDIIDFAQDGNMPTHEECYWAMLALNALGTFHTRSIMRLAEAERDYEPKNCKWATRKEQNLNKRTTRRLSVNGITRTIKEWASDLGLNAQTIVSRVERGWSAERAVTHPRIIHWAYEKRRQSI